MIYLKLLLISFFKEIKWLEVAISQALQLRIHLHITKKKESVHLKLQEENHQILKEIHPQQLKNQKILCKILKDSQIYYWQVIIALNNF